MIPRIWQFLTKKQQTIGSAAIILMCMVIASGLLGLIRLRMLYDRFTPEQTGVFFAAFRLPNFLFEMLAMGSLASAFIPVFTRYITRNDEAHAQKMASSIINLTVLILLIVAIPIFIFTEPICTVLAPGFNGKELSDMILYTRIMLLLQVVPLVVGNFFTGMLQSYKLFIVPALAPIVYNIGMILGIALFSKTYGLMAAVIGVGIGAFFFMVIHIPILIRLGYKHRFSFAYKDPGVLEVGKLMIPRLLGLGVSQIDVSVDLALSTMLGPKMVTVFFLAQSLQQIPVRLFGSTISQALLPTLSAASAIEDKERFKQSILSAYHMILFFVLPSSVLFVVLRIPIIRLTYGASLFDWEATVLTAMTLSMFACSLFAQAISQVFTRGFYALYDTKTPVMIGAVTIVINTTLSMIFIMVYHLPVWSLGLSTTIASILNAGILLFLLQKKVGGFRFPDLLWKPFKMLVAALVAGCIIFVPMKLFDQLVFDTTRVFGLLLLTGLTGGLGLVSYMFLAWVFDIGEVKPFIRLIQKVGNVRSFFIEPGSELTSGEVKDN
jgi:putative peptidoglycan lipid II flippase